MVIACAARSTLNSNIIIDLALDISAERQSYSVYLYVKDLYAWGKN